ncbi:N-acetylmuramoyl-L-alanine amidase CwlA [Aerococcus sp. 150760007-1]|uniref:N-acetylmuramoyl-L-alanine amidase n=1 Tax=Aerococcus urinaeequi TaxID=51665 RepID=A0ABR5ZXY1_9LACT|nr:N-acetylmuramoyl-L-alanine amidase [Aerococcus urinaeequi]MBA5746595.1 N-acetylmuramoyl-L-alanine amidase [Aerococcus urinaeequi]MBA5829354.1 N-acetylmuramoyl-L-alanine amidase [Aerococcus urinaeequi]MBA5860283.1 N-acetylmuramoyl-L-alanine amidase [Aerococcus urinaeequi]
MTYTIQKDLTLINKGDKGLNKPQWIIEHFVGAAGQAKGNANYFKSVYRGASAHYFVDPNNIIQVVEDDTPGWHVGDGYRTGKGAYNGYHGYGATNNNSIGIEMCQDTSTGKDVWHWEFDPETIKRAKWLTKQLQKKYNIPDERVIRHYDVSGKICPGNWQWNDWKKWREFKAELAGYKVAQQAANTTQNDGYVSVTAKMHTVQIGETLRTIAKKYDMTVDNLVKWNKLENPNLIFPESKLYVANPTATASTGQQLHLPASAKTWRVYNASGPYTSNYAIHQLTPSEFGGLTYDILGNPAPHVYLIKTSVKGKVAIYAGPGTGATITGKGGSVSNTTKKLYLPASADTWRVYRVKGPYTVGNEIHLLTPKKFGGLTYDIVGNPAKDIYLIDTDVKGRVAIYAGPGTGATIK